MSSPRRVAVLKGGRSLERNVSLRSGAHAQEALTRLGHEVIAIDVDEGFVEQLRAVAPDAALVALHGPDGEDGTLQSPARGDRPSLHGIRDRRRACAVRTRRWPST